MNKITADQKTNKKQVNVYYERQDWASRRIFNISNHMPNVGVANWVLKWGQHRKVFEKG